MTRINRIITFLSGNEVNYQRVVLFLFALAYSMSNFFYDPQGTQLKEFLLNKQLVALLPAALLLASYLYKPIVKYLSDLIGLLFTFFTIHLMGYFTVNNFNTHFELAIIPLVFFTNLHLNKISYISIYNLIVFSIIEYLFITTPILSENSESLLFMFFLLSVMLIGIVFQLRRIRTYSDVNDKNEILNSITKIYPDPWILFKGNGLAVEDFNDIANSIFKPSAIKDLRNSSLADIVILSNIKNPSDVLTDIKSSDNSQFHLNFNESDSNYTDLSLKVKKLPVLGNYILGTFNLKGDSGHNYHSDDIGIALQYRSYIESISEGLIVTSTQGDIRMFNKSASKLLSTKNKLAADKNISEFISDSIFNKLTASIEEKQSVSETVEFYISLSNEPLPGTNIQLRKTASIISPGNEYVWTFNHPAMFNNDPTMEPLVSKALINNWDSGITVLGIDQVILNCNKSFINICGYSEKELHNLRFTDLIHPNDIALFNSTGNGLKRSELRFINKSGAIKWALVNTIESENNLIIVSKDITRSKELELQLYELKSNIDALIENNNSPIVTLNFNQEILIQNNSFKLLVKELFGNPSIPGNSLWNYIPRNEKSIWVDSIEKVFKGNHITIKESLVLNKIKSVVEISFYPVHDNTGIVSGVNIIITDITQKEINESRLIDEKTKAETAMNAKSGFLATMSHEIRTPLNGLIGMAELLGNTSLSIKQQEYLKSIQLSGEALLNVINDILDYSRIESEKMELDIAPFELENCIKDTFEILYYKALERSNEMLYFIEPAVPKIIMGDKARLRQILLNLIGNAIKFTKNGDIRIHVKHGISKFGKTELEFSVKDTGVGIPKQNLEKIFNAFSQADASVASKYGGTGLGLAICTKLVGLMNGRIWVESEPGTGTTFFFTITVDTQDPKAVEFKRSERFNLKGQHFFILTNNPLLESKSKTYSKDWDAEISIFNDIQLLIIEATKMVPNGIIIDLAGYSTTYKEIFNNKTIEALHNVNKIIIIGLLHDEDLVHFQETELLDATIEGLPSSSKLGNIISNISGKPTTITTHAKQVSHGDLSKAYPANILIVEDNEVNQSLLKVQFEQLGYKPTIAKDGEEAIKYCDSTNFDLIFMDIQLPGITGIEATKLIFQKSNESKPSILAMTAYTQKEDQDACLRAGMMGVLTKPIKIDDISTAIKKWFPMQGRSEESLLDNSAIERIKKMADSDQTFIVKLLDLYFDQSESNINEIMNLISTEEFEKASASAHKLKGSSLNIGAKAIAELCLEIEKLVKTKNISLLNDISESLPPVFVSSKKQLQVAYNLTTL